MDLEGQRRRFPSQSGRILVGRVGLVRLPLVGLWVLVGLEWKALVALVGQVGQGDLVSQHLGQRGLRRWNCHCLGRSPQQVLAPLVGLVVLGDQQGQPDPESLEVLGVPWHREVREVPAQ